MWPELGTDMHSRPVDCFGADPLSSLSPYAMSFLPAAMSSQSLRLVSLDSNSSWENESTAQS